MTSVAPLLFDDVLGDVASRFGFAEVNTLALCCEPDVTPQLPVTKSRYSQQADRTKQQATPEPSDAAMAFVLGNGSAKNGARYPEKKQRDQKAHHQSVTAL